ncbi:nucleoside recognition domain-containing protein [Ruminococcus sp.]|uniref:nucleoside recognition domain-containing protein n=1 Tax=Ruminococcus sp. TaxID=41978 RepID=UPI0025EB301C|nr:nucleoside recognition domain-containing protein [Ruminococcus sp.]MBQ8966427.1 spore maturation protein A [Ruminococcus sp.]
MISFMIVLLLVCSAAAGFYNLTWEDISAAAVSSCSEAVQLGIFLAGSMALWGGLMAAAEASGLTKKAGKALSPVIRLLFGRLDDTSRNAVSLNMTANLLGLGNAVTPTGIAAVQALKNSPRPRRNIAVLIVLNTASVQLVPVTMAALRASHGSAAPFEILPAVLATSFIAAAVGVSTASLLYAGVEK